MSKLKKFHVPYGMTPTDLLNDNTISLTAKGLFGFLQSKPELQTFYSEVISTQCNAPIRLIESALLELCNHRFLDAYADVSNAEEVKYFYTKTLEKWN